MNIISTLALLLDLSTDDSQIEKDSQIESGIAYFLHDIMFDSCLRWISFPSAIPFCYFEVLYWVTKFTRDSNQEATVEDKWWTRMVRALLMNDLAV